MKRCLNHLLVLILFGSCSLIPERSFYEQMDEESFGNFFSPSRDFRIVSGDHGKLYPTQDEMMARIPASARDVQAREFQESIYSEVGNLKAKLPEDELHHYAQNEKHLANTSEKIYFLRLSDVGERNRYLSSKGIRPSFRTIDQIWGKQQGPTHDIRLGMSKQDVQSIYGGPLRIDVAGDPEYQNERWGYQVGNSFRYIYFEGGRVEGWTAPELQFHNR